MLISKRVLSILALTASLTWASIPSKLVGQEAPLPRLVIGANEAPEQISMWFDRLTEGNREIGVDSAEWMQLQFANFELGEEGTLQIVGENGQAQDFTMDQLKSWDGLTAMFNGSSVVLTLDSDNNSEVFVELGEVTIGLPVASAAQDSSIVPAEITNMFGNDIEKFLPQDDVIEVEAICGERDDRVSSDHSLVARIVPIGCTGFLFGKGAFLTAGHCIKSSSRLVHFNVPKSRSSGTTVAPSVRDQYRIIEASIIRQYTGLGNDWAIFEVAPNTQTGLLPMKTQGGVLDVVRNVDPSRVTVIGYGLDEEGKKNQTQQKHSGNLTEHIVTGERSAVLRHTADTRGGNSGSPVLASNRVAIGVHTNGGCKASGGANLGTSFRNEALWNAIIDSSSN